MPRVRWALSAKNGVLWFTVTPATPPTPPTPSTLSTPPTPPTQVGAQMRLKVGADAEGRTTVEVPGVLAPLALFGGVAHSVGTVIESTACGLGGTTFALRLPAGGEEWPRLTASKAPVEAIVKCDWDRWEVEDEVEPPVYGAHNRAEAQGLLNHISARMSERSPPPPGPPPGGPGGPGFAGLKVGDTMPVFEEASNAEPKEEEEDPLARGLVIEELE